MSHLEISGGFISIELETQVIMSFWSAHVRHVLEYCKFRSETI